METGIVFDIKRFAVHDGPGIRTTVFLKGCPLSCTWCHNPESQSHRPDLLYRSSLCLACVACVEACPENARALNDGVVERSPEHCSSCFRCVESCPSGALEKVGVRMSVDELLADIEKDSTFYDQSGGGVTFSGGEPLTQPGFLAELLTHCQQRDIHTAVDTCGFAQPASLRTVAENVDLFLFDLKLMDPRRHRRLTGASNELILQNLRMLLAMGKSVHVRVPIIPTLNDDAENLDAMGYFLSMLPASLPVTLLPHHPASMDKYPRFNVESQLPASIESPSTERMEELALRLSEFGLEVKVP